MKADNFPRPPDGETSDDSALTAHDSSLDESTDPALWTLLGRARPPAEPSPYFTRRVLREIERQEEERAHSGWRAWLAALARPRAAVWTTAAVAVAAVALTSVGLLLPSSGQRHHLAKGDERTQQQMEAGGSPNPVSIVTPIDPVADGDVSVIVELDDLLDAQKNRVWLDDDSAS